MPNLLTMLSHSPIIVRRGIVSRLRASETVGLLRRQIASTTKRQSFLAPEEQSSITSDELDTIYDKFKVHKHKEENYSMNVEINASSDGLLSQVNPIVLRNWSLFEACLRAKDFERADLVLRNLGSFKSRSDPSSNVPNTFFVDGVCEFLRQWGTDESTSLIELGEWLNHVKLMNRYITLNPKVVAWILKTHIEKKANKELVLDYIFSYRTHKLGNGASDILNYVDIIGLLNVRKLLSWDPTLKSELPESLQELFSLIGKELDEETKATRTATINIDTTDTTSTTNMTNSEETDDLLPEYDEENTSDTKILQYADDEDPGTIDNDMEEILGVTSYNLKTIRHSLMGIVASFDGGRFQKILIESIEESGLPVDLAEVKANPTRPINFFEMRKKLTLEQQAEFDEILDRISPEREKVLEASTIEAARRKWNHEFENLKDKAVPSSVGSYLHDWLSRIVPLIKKEIEDFDIAREKLGINATPQKPHDISSFDYERYKEKLIYGPYLLLLKPEKIATIAILEVLKSLVTSDLEKGTSVSSLVSNIGKNIEMEYKAERILKADIDVHKHYKAIKKTAEFRQFLRGSKAYKLIEAVEQKNMNSNNIISESAKVRWDAVSRCKIGSVLLSMLLQVAKVDIEGKDPNTGDIKKALAPAFYHTYETLNGGRIGVIKVNQRFAGKLGKDRMDHSIDAQFLPMISKPNPWTSFNNGGYYLKSTDVLRTKGAPEQIAYAKACANNGKMDQVLQGLNNLGYTSWTVNKRVLETMIAVWNTGEEFLEIPKAYGDLVLPPRPPKDASIEEKYKYRKDCSNICNLYSKNRSMRCDMNYKMEIARAFVGERIYFPHSVDFRGRAYPISPHFNHLGNDLARSLLIFWKGKRLGDGGLRWLKIHLSNLMGKDKISLDDRVKYTESNMDKIIESANDPLGKGKFWLEADKPWQCLATCIELSEAMKLDDPTEFISHQPVHQDGTCNGLQHYAALGGDEEGAQQVNLIPADKPSDIYTHVSKIVKANVDKDAAAGNQYAIAVQDCITRKLVKQTVMTSVYGVTFVGAKAQITKRLKEIDFDEVMVAQVALYLTTLTFAAIKQLFSGAHLIQDWLALAAKRISKSVRIDLDGEDSNEFLSSVIWTTPLGLTVVQPYRSYQTRQVSTNLQNIFILDPYEIRKVDARKQASAFPPNFVHSLDATHMLMSLNKCYDEGLTFASVHDSYWTHACDIDTMNGILRDQFIALHNKNLVSKLRSEFEQRYNDLLMQIEVAPNSDPCMAVKQAKKDIAKKLGRAPTLRDEVMLERERRRLLQSMDPEEIKLGKAMTTTISVLEDIDYEHTGTDDKTGTYKLLVPFRLPEVPARGNFDVSTVKDSQYFFS